jgi:peroxiredoxin/outer membrane lipoprotein-sorting protein
MKPLPAPGLLLAAAVVFGTTVTAATAQPATGRQPVAEISATYADVDTYQSTVAVAIEQKRGRWDMHQTGEAKVHFDRAGQRLAIDHPSFHLVITDKLRMRTPELRGTHLELPMTWPIQWGELVTHLGPLAEPALPDVVFLLAEDPQGHLNEGEGGPATHADGVVRFGTGTGEYRLHLDSDRRLTRAVHEMEPQKFGAPDDAEARVVFTFRDVTIDEPIDEDAFAFDTTDSVAQDSLQQMVAFAQGGGGGGGAGAGGGNHAMVDREAPDFELTGPNGETFKLSEATDSVIVLDFWATWCPPCGPGLQALQQVHNWAAEGDKSVAIYAVNVGEQADQVQHYWQRNNLSMPVLMDEDMAVGQAYGARAIPHTVVIADGKVRHVHTGYTPTLADDLKQEITGLLE